MIRAHIASTVRACGLVRKRSVVGGWVRTTGSGSETGGAWS